MGLTAVNTIILLASAVTMRLGLRANQRGERDRLIQRLSWTAVLGAIFLLIQGYEWLQLLHFGLTVSSSVYGGFFSTIIGFHAAHRPGAFVLLVTALSKVRRGPS